MSAAAERAEPVRLNMTPMIDVVFQLIVFFIVSMKFRTLDMKLDAYISGPGIVPIATHQTPPPKVDVRLARAAPGSPTEIRVAGATLGDATQDASWARLAEHLGSVRARQTAHGLDPGDVVGEVDASPSVPAGLVIRAIDTLRGADFRDVRFVGTAPLH